jgi:hypothetical protein
MAETYDPSVYTALIWPEHFRYFNMGRVLDLRAVGNSEGGQDLQAILSPNEYYLNANSYDQKLFTSMEIQADFRKTGKAYLIGLGATDSPASTGTTEVRFSRQDPDSMVSMPVEITFSPKPTKPSFIERFLGKDPETEDEAMDKEALKALAAEMKAFREELAALKPAQPSAEPPAKPAGDDDKFKALEEKFSALEQKIDALKPAEPPAKPAGEDDKFKALEEKFSALDAKITEALSAPHPGGTKPPANPGGENFDRKDYL